MPFLLLQCGIRLSCWCFLVPLQQLKRATTSSMCASVILLTQYVTSTLWPNSYCRLSSGVFAREVNAPSSSYFLGQTGKLMPRDPNNMGSGAADEDPSKCRVFNETFKENNCSVPMIIDSVTDGTFYALNGIIPGPTIVVTYDQTVAIKIRNSLINEELSIHWHGMHQNSTPWMDGVAHITQCPIDTYSSFQYIFKAIPSGTMWYHSHVGTQRTEGIFGSPVVREKQILLRRPKRNCKK